MTERGIEPRRLPTQNRSRERVDRILDAAAQLLVEQGYEAVKTNHIAKRAGVSVGSIYQFFPNRVAIFHALAVRYMDRISDILAEQLARTSLEVSWEDTIGGVITVLAELWRTEPAFMAVWAAIQNTPELRESDQHYTRIFVGEYLSSFLRRVLPRADDEKIASIARVMFEVSRVLLDYSMFADPAQHRPVIEELDRLLKSYVNSYTRELG